MNEIKEILEKFSVPTRIAGDEKFHILYNTQWDKLIKELHKNFDIVPKGENVIIPRKKLEEERQEFITSDEYELGLINGANDIIDMVLNYNKDNG